MTDFRPGETLLYTVTIGSSMGKKTCEVKFIRYKAKSKLSAICEIKDLMGMQTKALRVANLRRRE